MNIHLNRERAEELQRRVGREPVLETLAAWPRPDKRLPVVALDVDWVRFSTVSHRLRAQQRKVCRDRHAPDLFTADPLGDAAQQAQYELLQAYPSGELARLKTDLLERGQQEPAVVTAEGILINGNRRTAALRSLHREGNLNCGYVRCFVLPDDASDSEIRQLEAQLQVAERFEAEYSWVNTALLVDELLEANGHNTEIVAQLMRMSPAKITSICQELRLVDELVALSGDLYLHADFEADNSAFTELAAHIANRSAEEAEAVRTAYFLGVIAGNNYRDLRHFRRAAPLSFIDDAIADMPDLVRALETSEPTDGAGGSSLDDLLDLALGEVAPTTNAQALLGLVTRTPADAVIDIGGGRRVGGDALREQVNEVVKDAAREARDNTEEQDMLGAPEKRVREAQAKVNRAADLLTRARELPGWDEAALTKAVEELRTAVGRLELP